MSYNPHNQYRCTIIRGKAKNLLDDLLPAYASIISEIAPIDADGFREGFDERLKKYLPEADQKTIDNHRTEVAGKLFGMVYTDEDGTVYPSERTQKYLEDGDQPAFFKDMCYKFQFPNAADKLPKLNENLKHGISVRPYCLTVGVLKAAGAPLTKNEVAYFVLNNLDALGGRATAKEIVEAIFEARTQKKFYRVEVPGKESSYTMQHITEQLNYLELANLIRCDGGTVRLNNAEARTIDLFAAAYAVLPFDVRNYDIEDAASRKDLYVAWQRYYGELSEEAKSGSFATTLQALETETGSTGAEIPAVPLPQLTDTAKLGDDGERLVYGYEVKRVARYNKRLTNKVHFLGKTKGLGYDIQSIFADERKDGEFVKYIEVKSTKRVTPPSFENENWIDTLNITRNEWIAATQHRDCFEIYRVYFTSKGPLVAVLKNPYEKNERSAIQVLPTHYRLDFNGKSVDARITEDMLLTA